MRICSFGMNGFGIFVDQQVDELARGLNVFLGENEAGKSTTLGFFRTMLFGYPTKSNKAERCYLPLRGGNAGGWITLESASKGLFRLHRVPGKGKTITLRNDSGKEVPADTLHSLLGGVTRELFRTVYGFSLAELQNLASLDNEEVHHLLHSASFGSGSRPVGKVLQDCEKTMDKLFKPRGEKLVINSLLGQLRDVKEQLGALADSSAKYDKAYVRAQKLKEQLETVCVEQEKVGADLRACNRRLSQWDNWTALREKEVLLAAAEPITEFPADGLTRFEAALGELRAREEDIHAAEQRLSTQQLKVEQNVPDKKILAHAARIQGLVEGKEAYVNSLRELANIVQQQENLQGRLGHCLASLGPDWTSERVRAFDVSLFTREHIDKFCVSLTDSAKRMDEACREEDRLHIVQKDAQEQVLLARNAQEALSRPGHLADAALVRKLAAGRDRMESIIQNLPQDRKQIASDSLQLDSALADISPTWTCETMWAFDTSLPARRRMEECARALKQAEEYHLIAKEQYKVACQEKQRREEHHAACEATLSAPSDHATTQGIITRRMMLDDLRDAMRVRDSARDKLKLLEEQYAALPAARPNFVVGGAILFGVACLLSLLWYTVPNAHRIFAAYLPSVTAVYEVAVLCAVAGIWLARKGLSHGDRGLEQRRDSTRKDCEQYEEHAAKCARELGLDSADRKSVDSAEQELERLRTLAEEFIACQRQVDEALQELHKARQGAAQAAKRLGTADYEEQQCRNVWQDCIRAVALPETMQPVDLSDFFGRVERVRERANRLGEQREKMAKEEAVQEEYMVLVHSVPELADARADTAMIGRVDQWLVYVDEQDTAHRNYLSAQRVLEEKEQAHSRLQQELEAAVQAAQQAKAQHQNELDAWRNWLCKHGLPGGSMPDTARTALDSITEAQRILQEQETLASNRETLLQKQQRVHDTLQDIHSATDRTWDMRDAEQAINALTMALKSACSTEIRHNELVRSVEETRQSRDDMRERYARAQKRHDDLLQVAKARNEEELRLRAGVFLEQERWRRDIASREAELYAGTADDDALYAVSSLSMDERKTALQKMFAATSREELEARQQDLVEKKAKLQEENKNLQAEYYDVKAELRAMRDSDKDTELRAQREALSESLRRQAEQWATLALARHFVEQAKSAFEKERQPAVIKTATEFLHTITDGMYTEIYTSLEDNGIRAVTAGGQTRLPEELSRGTAEQLYLALRLGYISEHAAHGEPLPVIMDDILVNFDPHRAACAVRAFSRLARRHQVLLFTCHPATVDLVRKEAPDSAFFTIQDGTLGARCISAL